MLFCDTITYWTGANGEPHVINLGDRRKKKAKLLVAVQVELRSCEELLAKADVCDPDAEHPLGLSDDFKKSLKDKAQCLQTIVSKARAHLRRVRGKPEDIDDAVSDILLEEERLVSVAETRKKLFLALARGNDADAPCLWNECDGQSGEFLRNHSLLSQIWCVELNELVRNSQMSGLLAQLHPTSARAAAIQAAHAADGQCSSAEDVAVYIMEDPRT